LVLVVAASAVGVALLAGCGDDDSESGTMAGDGSRETDGAFIAEMTTHHDAAIEMAQMAQKRAEHREVRELADDIVAAQSEEIARMEEMHQRLFGERIGDSDHGSMGMPADEMGMDMNAMMGLENAKSFDRAFIDAMVPHHQGAIRMARVELERGSDPEVHELAEAIIEAQAGEIEMMNGWRERWYGEPSPSGGVPAEGEAPADEMMDDEMMEH
jgi:uncharacterized protein (DUF305 family)